MSRYRQVFEGEWVTPVHRGYRMACCNCGLVHRLNFRVVGRRIEFCAFRDNRATALVRRAWERSDRSRKKSGGLGAKRR